MEPIVSPWFIYAIGIADGVTGTWSELGTILTVAMVFTFIAIFYNILENNKDFKAWYLSIPVVVVIGWWIVFMFIPNSKTLMGMAVAHNITQDRVVKAGKVIYAAKDDLKRDIIDIITAVNTKVDAPNK